MLFYKDPIISIPRFFWNRMSFSKRYTHFILVLLQYILSHLNGQVSCLRANSACPTIVALFSSDWKIHTAKSVKNFNFTWKSYAKNLELLSCYVM